MKIRIEHIEVFGLEIPLVGAYTSAGGLKTHQKSVVVRISATGGLTGIGSVEPIPSHSAVETIEDVLKILKECLAPAIIGVDPTNINQLLPVLQSAFPAHSDAKVPIEMACVDLTARLFGVPVYTYLGGAVKKRLEFNAWIGILPAEEAASEALRWYRQGFRSAKIKLGGQIDADFERIAAVRQAVGSEMALRIDANEGYDASSSIRLAKMINRFDIQLFEQPAPRNDLAGLARVRKEGGIPVMADESISDHASLLNVIKAEAADIVKLGIKQQGGFHRVIHLLATAEAAGMRCVMGHGFGTAVSTLAEITLAATTNNVIAGLECVGPLKMKDSIVKIPFDISSGNLQLPSGPGLGVTLDDTKLEKYSLAIVG